VDVRITVNDGELVLTVADNGVGGVRHDERGGLANLRSRAERHGGTFTVTPDPAGGTVVRWTVPI
jgi:signal transduction histidine kinase